MSSGQPGRILIVDDDEAARYVKSRVLQRHGYTVSEASLGRDALALAAAEEPHLTLLDVKLPRDQIPFPKYYCPADLGRLHRGRRSHSRARWRRRFLSRRADRAG